MKKVKYILVCFLLPYSFFYNAFAQNSVRTMIFEYGTLFTMGRGTEYTIRDVIMLGDKTVITDSVMNAKIISFKNEINLWKRDSLVSTVPRIVILLIENGDTSTIGFDVNPCFAIDFNGIIYVPYKKREFVRNFLLEIYKYTCYQGRNGKKCYKSTKKLYYKKCPIE